MHLAEVPITLHCKYVSTHMYSEEMPTRMFAKMLIKILALEEFQETYTVLLYCLNLVEYICKH